MKKSTIGLKCKNRKIEDNNNNRPTFVHFSPADKKPQMGTLVKQAFLKHFFIFSIYSKTIPVR